MVLILESIRQGRLIHTPEKLPIALILIIYFSLYEFLNEFTLDIVQYNLSTNSSSSPD